MAIVLYTTTELKVFANYASDFDYSLTQNQFNYYRIVNDENYYNNRSILRTEIDSALQIEEIYANDIYSAQNALDRAKYLMDNQDLFF